MKYSSLKIKDHTAAVNDLYVRLTKPKKTSVVRKERSRSDSQNHLKIVGRVAQLDQSGKFEKLLDGDTSDYPSTSEADLAFCSFLTKETNSTQTIDSIFRKSKLMRKKWDIAHGDKTYGATTIQKALNKPMDKGNERLNEKATEFEIAKAVIKKIGRKNIYSLAHKIWLWRQEEGVWRTIADEELKKYIHRIAHAKSISNGRVNSIFGLINTEIYSTVSRFDKCDKRVINCSNGELHFENGSFALKPHHRDSNFCHQISVNYDADAKCERFRQFLQEVFAVDADKKQKIRLLQEFFGYVLITSCEFERLLLLVGSGSNGKSVIITTLMSLIGEQYVSSVLPNQFERLPQLAHLHGKLANIITEIPEGSVIADAKIKSITSGESMTAEHKFGHPFDFKPYSTLIFSANHLPHTKDSSQAFFRRVEVLTFNVSFTGDIRDTTLKDKLTGELPGILNFALKGLKRLLENGDFTEVPSSKAAKREWELAADQVSAFIDDECEFDATAKTPIGKIYERYKDWALESGIKSYVNKPNLTSKLKLKGCKAIRGSQGVRMIAGIKLKTT